MKKNDIINVTIQNYGCNAEGVAKHDGQVVFLPYTIVGENVTATIINDKHKFLIGKAIEIKNPSNDRNTPLCPYFSKCGGCQLQHMKYSKSLEIKKQIVQEAITNIGKINFDVNNCVESDNVYQYRNKIALPINPKTRQLAMYRTGSHNMIDISTCCLQKDDINKLINIFNKYLRMSKTSVYDEEKKQGVLKFLVAREINGCLLVTVVINANKLADSDLLVSLLKQNFDNFGVNLNINTEHNNVILSQNYIELYGLTEVQICENEIRYAINNKSFLQINEDVKNKIYTKVFNEISGQIVVDAYSGAGLLSAMMSKHAEKVYGIEIIKPATELANKLKKQNNIENLTNINGDCAKELPKLLNTLNDNKNLYIVLDPPRKGCDKKVLDAIALTSPKEIIYISCNPSTLARDLNFLLKSDKYDIKSITPFDMFPQTKHVETLAILKRK